MNNRSRELQNLVSPGRTEYHFRSHGGSSNGLAQVTRHSGQSIKFQKSIFDVADPNFVVVIFSQSDATMVPRNLSTDVTISVLRVLADVRSYT